MNKDIFYKFIIGALLVSNVFLVVFMVGPKRPPHGKGQAPREIIIDRLSFSDSQISEYDKLIKVHRAQIENLETEMRDLKARLYSKLKSDVTSAETDTLIQSIAATQQRIEKVHFSHFMDIKQLCTTEQKLQFNQLSEELAGLFAPRHPKHARP